MSFESFTQEDWRWEQVYSMVKGNTGIHDNAMSHYCSGAVDKLNKECFNTCVITPLSCETVMFELQWWFVRMRSRNAALGWNVPIFGQLRELTLLLLFLWSSEVARSASSRRSKILLRLLKLARKIVDLLRVVIAILSTKKNQENDLDKRSDITVRQDSKMTREF